MSELQKLLSNCNEETLLKKFNNNKNKFIELIEKDDQSFHLLIGKSYFKVVEKLIEEIKSPNIFSIEDIEGFNVLQRLADEKKELLAIKLLTKFKGLVNSSLFHIAIYQKLNDLSEILINNFRYKYGDNYDLFDSAIDAENKYMIDMMINKTDCSENRMGKIDHNQKTILFRIIEIEEFDLACKMIDKFGSNTNPEQISKEGESALSLACEYNRTALAEKLILICRSPLYIDVNGNTSLSHICENKNFKLISLFIDKYGSDLNSIINLKDCNQISPLSSLVKSKSFESANILTNNYKSIIDVIALDEDNNSILNILCLNSDSRRSASTSSDSESSSSSSSSSDSSDSDSNSSSDSDSDSSNISNQNKQNDENQLHKFIEGLIETFDVKLNPSNYNNNGETALMNAINSGYLNVARLLIDSFGELNFPKKTDIQGRNIFNIAIENETDIDFLSYLTEKFNDPYLISNISETGSVLLSACKSGYNEDYIISILEKLDPKDLIEYDDEQISILGYCMINHLDKITETIMNKIDSDQIQEYLSKTLLGLCCRNSCPCCDTYQETLTRFMEKINSEQLLNNTIIFENGNSYLIELIYTIKDQDFIIRFINYLGHKSFQQYINEDGNTALEVALSRELYGVANYLMEKFKTNCLPNSNYNNEDKYYAFSLLCQTKNPTIVQKFIDFVLPEKNIPKTFYSMDSDKTLLMSLLRFKELEEVAINFLNKYGKRCNIFARNSDGESALTLIAQNNLLKMFDLVTMEYKPLCRYKSIDSEGNNPLSIACKYNHQNMALKMLKTFGKKIIGKQEILLPILLDNKLGLVIEEVYLILKDKFYDNTITSQILTVSVQEKWRDLTNLLLKDNITIKYVYNYSPLLAACQIKNEPLALEILDKYTAETKDNQTAKSFVVASYHGLDKVRIAMIDKFKELCLTLIEDLKCSLCLEYYNDKYCITPCGHTGICINCLNKCEVCPNCRGPLKLVQLYQT